MSSQFNSQLELFPSFSTPDRLTVSELLSVVVEHHLCGKPCQRPYRSNARALSRSFVDLYYDLLTEPDLLRHMARRAKEGLSPQTIKHDIKLMVLAWNTARRYKRNKWKVGGFNFTNFRMPEEDPAKYIARPQTQPRKKPVTEMDFAKWIEQCHPKLAERSFFAIDTGLSEIELKKLRPRHYNAYSDCLDIQRGKSGKVGSLPVSTRCRSIIFEAIKEGREFILDWTNHQKQVKSARKKSGVYFWFGRDLRTTYGNEIFDETGSDQAASRAMLHKDPRTFLDHYKVDRAHDLRPAIQEIEKRFK